MSNDNRQVRLKSRPDGIPRAEHFEIAEAPLPELRAGDFLVRKDYLSVEPAMRGWASAIAGLYRGDNLGKRLIRPQRPGVIGYRENPTTHR